MARRRGPPPSLGIILNKHRDSQPAVFPKLQQPGVDTRTMAGDGGTLDLDERQETCNVWLGAF